MSLQSHLWRTALVAAALNMPWTMFADIIGQASTPNGSAFVSTCAGLGYSSDLEPGVAWTGNASGGTNCTSATAATVTVSAAATASAAPNPFPYVDYAQASASLGQLHLYATHTGDGGYYFPEAYADAGWNDMMAPDVMNIANVVGTTGVWVIPLTVTGSFITSGPDPGAAGFVDIYQNGQTFSDHAKPDDAAYDVYKSLNPVYNVANGFPGAGWSDEMIGWSATTRYSGYGTQTPSTTIFFALPVTLGQSYSIGIWADVSAGEYSAGAANSTTPQDSATSDMSHSILWDGPGYFIDGAGNVHTDVNIISGSGFNYNVAATDSAAAPEPSTWALLLSGAALIAFGLKNRKDA